MAEDDEDSGEVVLEYSLKSVLIKPPHKSWSPKSTIIIDNEFLFGLSWHFNEREVVKL